MQKKFIFSNSNVQVVKFSEEAALDTLPPKVYVVKHDKMIGFYLEVIKNNLDIPSKIYGNVNKRVTKCIRSYKDRDSSMGVLLTGDKGTGKSLLMSKLANTVIDELNLPVIIIKQAYSGELFSSFLNDIGECCIVLDEFGKMYKKNSYGPENNEITQNEFLSIMDGIDKLKRMFIMTENDEFDISEFILNRPSRVYYHFRYKKLDEDSIIGYYEDHDIDYEITNDIIHFSRNSSIFSFDMLKAIVEEYLRFGESVKEIINDLNIKSNDEEIMVEIKKVLKKGTDIEMKPKTTFIKKPSRHTFIELVKEDDKYEDEFSISNTDIVYEHDDKIIYETSEYTVITRVLPQKQKNYSLLV